MRVILIKDVLNVVPENEDEDKQLRGFFKDVDEEWNVCPHYDGMTNMHMLTIRKEPARGET